MRLRQKRNCDRCQYILIITPIVYLNEDYSKIKTDRMYVSSPSREKCDIIIRGDYEEVCACDVAIDSEDLVEVLFGEEVLIDSVGVK